jgi:hypothetical protein
MGSWLTVGEDPECRLWYSPALHAQIFICTILRRFGRSFEVRLDAIYSLGVVPINRILFRLKSESLFRTANRNKCCYDDN